MLAENQRLLTATVRTRRAAHAVAHGGLLHFAGSFLMEHMSPYTSNKIIEEILYYHIVIFMDF